MIYSRIKKLGFPSLLTLILLSMGMEICFCQAMRTGEQSSTLSNDAAPSVKHTVELRYKLSELGLTVLCKDVNRTHFEKEPDFGNRTIVRGLIPLGTDKKEHIGFAWDRTNNNLYLDLNRNQDLTDDPNGVFQSERSGQFQYFQGIHLSLQKGTVSIPYEIRMEMYQYGQRNLSCSATIVTGFAGEMTLYGKKWDVSLVDNMSGSAAPGDYFFLAPQDVDLGTAWNWRKLNVPKSLFFDSHHYDVSFGFRPGTTKPILQLTLAESEKPTGQLDIDGENIARLVLQSDSCIVLLHHPDKSVSIPAGDYRCRGIYLYDEKFGLFEGEQIDVAGPQSVSVRQNQSTSLKAGGPLNHSIDVRREGNTLVLSYKLLGTGRLGYQRPQGRLGPAPTFTIHRGDTKIASGTFEYG